MAITLLQSKSITLIPVAGIMSKIPSETSIDHATHSTVLSLIILKRSTVPAEAFSEVGRDPTVDKLIWLYLKSFLSLPSPSYFLPFSLDGFGDRIPGSNTC